MELRAFAEQVLYSNDLGIKITRITESLIDTAPGEAVRIIQPTRPANLQFAERKKAPSMPKAESLKDVRKRAIAHHVMANHELQALEYVAGLPLVFEGANLDHTAEFEQYFRAAGDRRSAAIMRAIHKDEIRHVKFGLNWLRQLNPAGVSDWDAWTGALHWPIRPSKARGDLFQREARLQAGLTPEFIERLEAFDETGS